MYFVPVIEEAWGIQVSSMGGHIFKLWCDLLSSTNSAGAIFFTTMIFAQIWHGTRIESSLCCSHILRNASKGWSVADSSVMALLRHPAPMKERERNCLSSMSSLAMTQSCRSGHIKYRCPLESRNVWPISCWLKACLIKIRGILKYTCSLHNGCCCHIGISRKWLIGLLLPSLEVDVKSDSETWLAHQMTSPSRCGVSPYMLDDQSDFGVIGWLSASQTGACALDGHGGSSVKVRSFAWILISYPYCFTVTIRSISNRSEIIARIEFINDDGYTTFWYSEQFHWLFNGWKILVGKNMVVQSQCIRFQKLFDESRILRPTYTRAASNRSVLTLISLSRRLYNIAWRSHIGRHAAMDNHHALMGITLTHSI